MSTTGDASSKERLEELLGKLEAVRKWLLEFPYSLQLYLEQARLHQLLGYPDLAVGAAYKALLLSDALNDDCDEYYEQVLETVVRCSAQPPPTLMSEFEAPTSNLTTTLKALKVDDSDGAEDEAEEDRDAHIVGWANSKFLADIIYVLAENLLACQCYRSAYKQCQIGLANYPDHSKLAPLRYAILEAVRSHFQSTGESVDNVTDLLDEWPDSGLVRRECYPWNDIEPDRFSEESLDFLNAEMAKCAPKFEVKAVDLPVLTSNGGAKFVKQLGVFAREDIEAGESVLKEVSLMTANNRLQDALCDACGKDIDDGVSPNDDANVCPECSVLFCSQDCLVMADYQYHPAVCDKDVDSIARDVPPAQAADSLYLLLLLRSFALAETQETHPLELKEVKYIWGDYHFTDVDSVWRPPKAGGDAFANLPRSLPFSFESNVVLPFHMLTKMDVDIYQEFQRYDVWIFNTLYAKFRGTASARLSGVSRTSQGLKLSRRRGPEVSAVHPCWCLANHSCDPNVQWEWGGKVEFSARKERVQWKREGTEELKAPTKPGIKKGEEILNHYCDIGLDVESRREWAQGALGGDCKCERCIWEAKE